MYLPVSLSALLLLIAATSVEAALFRSPNVKHLTTRSFKKSVQSSPKLTIAAFTAPWCGYCKQLGSEFDKVADSLKGLINVVNVDCDEDQNKQICGEYGVQGFPTLKIFPGGTAPPRSYDGPRTAKEMISYATSSMPTFVKRATNRQELEAILKKASPSNPISLLLTSSPKVTPLYKSLSTDFYRSIEFYAARDVKVGKETMRELFEIDVDETGLPVLVILTGEGNGVGERYQGPLKYDKLHSFLNDFAIKAKKGESQKAGGAKEKKKKNDKTATAVPHAEL